MPEASPVQPLQVVVVGGGIAALEAVLALHDLSGARLEVTLIAPEPDFVLRPMAVVAPFSRGRVDQLALEQVMREHGGQFLRNAVKRVDTDACALTLVTGEEVTYDALVLAQGATEIAALPLALTFGADPSAFNGLLADLEQGCTGSVAFVLPDGNTWPLPLYELALMTAEEAWAMNMDRVELHLITTEPQPLGVFGTEASAAVAQLLTEARIALHLGVHSRMTRSGHVETSAGESIVVDRVVALPVLQGRQLDGIACDAHGFITVDDAGLVAGLDSVYAVGDVTDRPIKQGGLACQQADVAAAHIARRAGATVDVGPLQQVLRGRLLTGAADRFMRRGSDAADGTVHIKPLWWPPAKVSGKYLSPYLAAKQLVHLPARSTPPAAGVDVDVGHPRRVPGGIVEAKRLRPITPLHTGLHA